MTRQEPTSRTWQLREVLETLLRGDLVVPKTAVDGDANVRSLLIAMAIDGLATWDEANNNWVFRITEDGREALSEATRDSALMRRVTESAEAFRRDNPQ